MLKPANMPSLAADSSKIEWRLLLAPVIWAGALGYLVDIFDLNLDANYRQQLFHSFGVPSDQTVPTVIAVANWSRSGVLLGGFFWGILGDKVGRLFSLFGSIALYSVAILAIALFCHSLSGFKVGIFLVGLGLSGELGGSVTLVLESLPTVMRTFGVMFVAAMGMLGVVFAGLLVEVCSWRTGFAIGGIMGLMLLVFRFQVRESLIFKRLEATKVSRGNWFALLWPWRSLEKYLCCILIGAPALFVLFFYAGFAPEIGKEMQVVGDLKVNRASIAVFMGLATGDILIAGLSYWLKSRKRPILWYLASSSVIQSLLLTCHGVSNFVVYALFFGLGMASANALYVTTMAEQFGTNLRDTATTTITNFIRFGIVPLSFLLTSWKVTAGLVHSGFVISMGTLILGVLGLSRLKETYGADVEFVEN